MTYPVLNTDRMYGTTNRDGLRSIKFFEGSDKAGINNGCVVEVFELIEGSREIHKATAPSAADIAKTKLCLVGAPELTYDERLKNISDFSNQPDVPTRTYTFHVGSEFSLSSDGFAVTEGLNVTKGCAVEIAAGDVKMHIKVAPTEGVTQIGTIEDMYHSGSKTFYTVLVD